MRRRSTDPKAATRPASCWAPCPGSRRAGFPARGVGAGSGGSRWRRGALRRGSSAGAGSRHARPRDTGFQILDGTTVGNHAAYAYSAAEGRPDSVRSPAGIRSPTSTRLASRSRRTSLTRQGSTSPGTRLKNSLSFIRPPCHARQTLQAIPHEDAKNPRNLPGRHAVGHQRRDLPAGTDTVGWELRGSQAARPALRGFAFRARLPATDR